MIAQLTVEAMAALDAARTGFIFMSAVVMSGTDDEVDILGEMPAPSPPAITCYSDLLKCDYTVHPQWLLDSATTACWYDNPQQFEPIENINENSDDEHKPSTSSEPIKWTNSERKMLQKGIEIYGQDMQRLSVFVGTKTPDEIRTFIDTEYGINLESHIFGLESNISNDGIKQKSTEHDYGEILADNEIPASIEEVITMVNSAESTDARKLTNKKQAFITNHKKKKKETDVVADDSISIISEVCNKNDSLVYGLPKKLKTIDTKSSDVRKYSKPLQALKKTKIYNIKRIQNKYRNQSFPVKSGQFQIVTGRRQVVNKQEVIKIERCAEAEADHEIEVNIECDDDPNMIEDENKPDISRAIGDGQVSIVDSEKVDLSHVKDEIRQFLESNDVPSSEFILNQDGISDLERALCPDFFEGRPTKTPERYSAIRSHLIHSWNQCRPNYLNKTAARNGLRNCGDVNCIGRVHLVLEQIGAINYGCDRTSYIRPLVELLNKSNPPATSAIEYVDVPRNRKKKIVVDGEGGYTITHSENGEILEAFSEPRIQRPVKKKPLNLIYCKAFDSDCPAPYFVQLSLSALILMDVHSYMSHSEVMGLLGGQYDPDSHIVSIDKYVPCDSLEDSGTHCDMCPISQSIASESIREHGLETVGWYHSHPLFPPHPSSQDILSQADLQQAFDPRPFLALIVSPYWPPGRTSSQYRCFITRKDSNSNSNYDPYGFKINLNSVICNEEISDGIDVIQNQISKLRPNFIVNMNEICPIANISFLEKVNIILQIGRMDLRLLCLSSVRTHLNACNTPDLTTEEIVSRIRKKFI